MKKSTLILTAIAALSLIGLVSCNKEATNIPEEEIVPEQTITVEDAVDILTKSLTKEDLEGLSLFLKGGSSDESFYLEIEKEGKQLVKGEISLAEGEKYKIVSLDLTAVGIIPITGTIDALKFGIYMAEASMSLWSYDLLQKALDKVNGTIDLDIMYGKNLMFLPEKNADSHKCSIEAYLVDSDNPENMLKISELIAMFS